MSMVWIGVTGLAISAVGTGLSLSNQPQYPDTAASSKELSDVEAQMLPIRRKLEAAAQQGGKVTIDLPARQEKQQVVTVGHGLSSKVVPYVASEWAMGGKYNRDGSQQPQIQEKLMDIPAGPQEVDFTGYGEADVQGKVAQEMARIQLALSQKYDSQFIDQALAQEKLADPESFAARAKMDELIQSQISRKPDRPVADLMNQQVGQELSAARDGKLDMGSKALLDQAAAAAVKARGGQADGADFEAPLTTGFEGTARKQAAAQKGLGWLSSGATPEDVDYRREQQDLSNLSARISGQTPQSQFGSLSGAQQGATPFVAGKALPGLPADNSQSAANVAIGTANAANSASASQVSPWMAGLTTLLGIGNVAGKSGWKPLAG